jgi:hypothetical protein
MRLFFGIILGAVLTVGAAYVYDNMSSGASAAGATTQRTMVNWDVVGDNWRTLKDRAIQGWSKLSKPSAG